MNYIREHRKAMELSQNELANCLQTVEPRLDVGMISRFEGGVCLPTKHTLDKMAEFFGIDVDDLYDREDLELIAPLVIKPLLRIRGYSKKGKGARRGAAQKVSKNKRPDA